MVGAHIFYRWKGGAGERSAFRQDYLGSEPGAAAPAAPVAFGSRAPKAILAGARSVLRVERQQLDGATVAIHRGAGLAAHRPLEAAPEPVETATIEAPAAESFGVRIHKGAAPAD